ncbi:hypothetical protein CJ030_MR8G027537 [Morella rubra]|uniref:Uncharacterized protein n=1 Tax=Morella rubra TaxID=262757 RepID=A0A6A1UVQ3_9ROSI|nr:hypothetical protein CJ030_MR8G027537 [Morella rubra]
MVIFEAHDDRNGSNIVRNPSSFKAATDRLASEASRARAFFFHFERLLVFYGEHVMSDHPLKPPYPSFCHCCGLTR